MGSKAALGCTVVWTLIAVGLAVSSIVVGTVVRSKAAKDYDDWYIRCNKNDEHSSFCEQPMPLCKIVI